MSDNNKLYITFNKNAGIAEREIIGNVLRDIMSGDDAANSMTTNWQEGTAVITTPNPLACYRVLSDILARDPNHFPLNRASLTPLF